MDLVHAIIFSKRETRVSGSYGEMEVRENGREMQRMTNVALNSSLIPTSLFLSVLNDLHSSELIKSSIFLTFTRF